MACSLHNSCLERSKMTLLLFKLFDLNLKTITDWFKNHSLILSSSSITNLQTWLHFDAMFYILCSNRTRVLFTIVNILFYDWSKNIISIQRPKNLIFTESFKTGIDFESTFYFKFISIVPVECLYCSNKKFLSDVIGQKTTVRSVLRESQKQTIILFCLSLWLSILLL